MVSLPAGEVADLRDAVRERDRLRAAAQVAEIALRDVFEAINAGHWDLIHDTDCPEDDTCECPCGIQGTAGLVNAALTKTIAALASLRL
jgi:hypothetical protein